MDVTKTVSNKIPIDSTSETNSTKDVLPAVGSSLSESSTQNNTNKSIVSGLSNENTYDKHSGSPSVAITDSIVDSSETQESSHTASGFDSADSTNDEDFLVAQKGILSAINLMEEGLKDEESLGGCAEEDKSSSNIPTPNNGCEELSKTSSSEKPESKTDEDKLNSKICSVSEKTNTINSQFNNSKESRGLIKEKSDVDSGICISSFERGDNSEKIKESAGVGVDSMTVESHSQKEASVEPINNMNSEKCTEENESSNDLLNAVQTNNENIEALPQEKSLVNCESDCTLQESDLVKSEVKEENFTENDLIVENLEKRYLEDLAKVNSSKSKSDDVEVKHGSKSDDPVFVNTSPSPETEDIKRETKSNLLDNVELGLYDEEISVLKYEEAKDEEFKLDYLVLTSDEDSNGSEKIKDKSSNADTSTSLSNTLETTATLKLSEKDDDKDKGAITLEITNESHSNLNESFVTEGMDLEDSSLDQKDTNEKKENEGFETESMDLEDSSLDQKDTNENKGFETESMDLEYLSHDQKDTNEEKEEIAAMDKNMVDGSSEKKNQEFFAEMDLDVIDESSETTSKLETIKMDIDNIYDNSKTKAKYFEHSSSECSTTDGTGCSPKKSEIIETDCHSETSNSKDEVKPNLDDPESVLAEDEVSIDSKIVDSNNTSDSKETDLEDMLRTALFDNEKFRENLSSESNSEKKLLERTTPDDTEVICLVDDDDNVKKKPAAAVNCVNPNCMSGEDLAPPPMFALSYFRVKRSKGQKVCAECFEIVLEHYKMLGSYLEEKKPLLSAKFPSHKDVILLDSDEEEPSDNESYLSDDTMSVVRDNLDDLISESLAKYDFDFQMKESCEVIKERLTKLEEECQETAKKFDAIHELFESFREQIYGDFKQEIREVEEVHYTECEIPSMPTIKSKAQNQMYNKEINRIRKCRQERVSREGEEQAAQTRTIATKRVSQVSQQPHSSTDVDVTYVRSEVQCEPPPNLPNPGPLVRPKLRVGDMAYTMKVSYFSIWVQCRIIEVIPRNPTESDPSTETYRIRLEYVKKNSVRTVTGKYLAYPTPARVQLPVGIRVIAIFKEEDDSASKDKFYVGVIAEPPKCTNKYRYLVFFDDGYTQYCPHENILVVCSTSKNVWEDIHPEPRDFIKNYLQQYPERPMVKLSRGQIVKVEWNGRWWIVRVLEVDGSLVKVHFDADRRTEWIYRGSTRLGPMYQELAAAKERQHGSLLRSRGFGGGTHHKKDMPYVEYTRGDVEGDNKEPECSEKKGETVEEPVPAPRSVARKSTAKKPVEPVEPVISNNTYCKPLINYLPEGRVRQRKLRPKCCPMTYRHHKECNEGCAKWTGHSVAAAKKYDPLVKPLIFGYERMTTISKGKTLVYYRSPCGRWLRNSEDVLKYLSQTKSQLTIDLFDFDFWVNPLAEFEEGSTFGKIEDLSYGKENVRISCVNELDHSMPQYVQYMTTRQPAKDVHLNLDPEFLACCDCTDNCEDRSKCSCWSLTMQGKAYVPDGDLDPLFGYQYRRLPERIATGIYECNSRCKCSQTCQNRVAQQPLSCRLQLFKTLKKGWGIRCLHDIPRGTFICVYVGFLLTEQEANEGGKTYGDEYLAELDYIESVESLKEGYESEAREMEDEDQTPQRDTMYIEYENSGDSDTFTEHANTKRHKDIRLRLRRRTIDEAEKESRKYKPDDDAISISDDEVDSDFYYTVTPFNDEGQCGGCRESLFSNRDSLRCQGCLKSYHFKCTSIKSSTNVQTLGSNKSSWVCSKCEALVRKPKTFDANITVNEDTDEECKYPSVRELYGPDETVYIMDAKTHGNIGRYLNHSCSPNVFVQNVFVDTHDLRFPWVAFFANQYIPAGTELTWDYNYDVGSVPGKVMLCYCGSNHCRGRLL